MITPMLYEPEQIQEHLTPEDPKNAYQLSIHQAEGWGLFTILIEPRGSPNGNVDGNPTKPLLRSYRGLHGPATYYLQTNVREADSLIRNSAATLEQAISSIDNKFVRNECLDKGTEMQLVEDESFGGYAWKRKEK